MRSFMRNCLARNLSFYSYIPTCQANSMFQRLDVVARQNKADPNGEFSFNGTRKDGKLDKEIKVSVEGLVKLKCIGYGATGCQAVRSEYSHLRRPECASA